ncbi:MAG: patatin-like phospholipase family protein [Bacteroides sp.]|nr:patatin-like phospholipase family protein [Bacteroides sp.]
MLNLFGKPTHRIGIALSGGGARGFAHAGALMALEQAGIRPDIIAGVSAGSVVAAMYASGLHPRSILEVFNGAKFNDLAGLSMPHGGFFSLDRFRGLLKETIPVKNLEDMPIPTVVGVTNFDTGKPEAFRSGPVNDIVAASCSIPIVFQPAVINGMKYVDGGLLHNLPAWAIREQCKILIGINCSPIRSRNISRNNLLDTALRSYDLVAKSNAVQDMKLCDLVISFDDIADYKVFDLSGTEGVFSSGYEAALKAIRSTSIKF